MIKKTIGGDRLGSGNKMKAALHNYERSTHDLGNVWRSTMAPGVLVPFYKKICTNGDTWTINLQELVRTMPAIGPLFGTYKLQLDMFEVPIRLYNGILHNNMTKIGMDMSKVKLPKVQLQAKVYNPEIYESTQSNKEQISSSSLMAYLGLRGIGSALITGDYISGSITRKFNAVPVLGYYDIFKNYYANKQEEDAYVIDNDIEENKTEVTNINYRVNYLNEGYNINFSNAEDTEITNKYYLTSDITIEKDNRGNPTTDIIGVTDIPMYPQEDNSPNIVISNLLKYIVTTELKINGPYKKGNSMLKVFLNTAKTYLNIPRITDSDVELWEEEYEDKTGKLKLKSFKKEYITNYVNDNGGNNETTETIMIVGFLTIVFNTYKSNIKLKNFPLSNIDDMRMWLLQNTTLGTELVINNLNKYPYKANYEVKTDGLSACKHTMNGLCVKTYQSDIFNCWLSSQWIDSINGINAMSAVAIEEGKFTIDALNLAHKVYNMLNRIAISGGTYEDWQEAVYGEDALRRAESPIYCGGASGLIQFEEVVSTADTETTNAGDQPLGSLAGKGILTNVEGGNIEIHIKEPSYIIGIASITPYIDYCQGNDFDMTELDSLNDLHKPELDEIGFQDLLLERAAWWGTYYDYDEQKWVKSAGGKQPAWLEYMTSVNQVFGEFAEKDKLGYMVLRRDYEGNDGFYSLNESENINDEAPAQKYTMVKDWTTYINPTKFNYQFADTSLTAQNFWVQIGINAICRRKISAKLIPNL